MKKPTGYVYKDGDRWVARVTYTDASGKRRNLKKYRETITEAKRARDMLLRELEERGGKSFDSNKLRFRDLVEKYSQMKLTEPVYSSDVKISGMKSLASAKTQIKVLIEFFGNRKVKDITYLDLVEYKVARSSTNTRKGRLPAIASVNRELERMRAILNFAVRQGIITINPFNQGEPLIVKSAETSRGRLLSFEEEKRLLAECKGRRSYLRPLIIAAIDTGLRKGELLKLVWADIDMEAHIIQIRAKNSKTNRPREVAMTNRLLAEFKKLAQVGYIDPVFGVTSDVKKSFSAICAAAGIESLQFRDFRHTCVTRLIEAGMQTPEAMKISGHTTLAMLNRYLNINKDTSKRAATALDMLLGKHFEVESDERF
jgi:integrase